MYETFYGLRERPFSLLPDPDYLYLSPKHLRALTLLEYGMMNQAGFSVICGDTGAGKTTLIRHLLNELGSDTTVGLITNTHKSFGELLSWVLMAFGIDGEGKSKALMHQLLIEFLIDQYAQNRHTVLIVDEAQNMTADTLEELRMLSNINSDKDQVLQVILAGQPALRETLRRPELMQFAQRIAVDYYLESLNRDETQEYIKHRLEVAGGNTEIFTAAACHAVYRYSGGTPRLINLLCDTALVYGFAEQTQTVDAPLIEDVVREQHRNSIVPTFNKPLDYDANEAAQAKTQSQTKVGKQQKSAAKAVAESRANKAAAKQAAEQPVAALGQAAVNDYEARLNVGHGDTRNTVTESVSVYIPPAPKKSREPQNDPADTKVTPIKNNVWQPHPESDQENDLDVMAQSASDQAEPGRHSTTSMHQHRRQTDLPLQSDNTVNEPCASADDDVLLDPEIYQDNASDSSAYKNVYPIVHIAEPKKNFNGLILGFAGGMVLTSVVVFAAAWMLLRQDMMQPPAAPTQPPTQHVITTPTDPVVSPHEQAQLEALQQERDAAKATTEELKRERDAALAAAQKQEALRTVEKRANEIIAGQERKHAGEMEKVRQRAFEAEVSAAKARERERVANEEAERAHEAARKVAASASLSAAQTPATAQPAAAQPEATAPAHTDTKPAPTTKSSSSESGTQFSANPCNSPSAKFLSTCKK